MNSWKKNTLALSAALTTVFAGAAISDGHADKQLQAAVKARQSHMQLYSFNLGILGGMAKGAVKYNADTASAAASNLAAVATLNQSFYWPPGSDSDSIEGSRALPAIWQEGSKAGDIGKQLAEAAMKMQADAGNGLEALQAGMGPIGGACKACHDDYRKPQ